jgi:hypothetical protein
MNIWWWWCWWRRRSSSALLFIYFFLGLGIYSQIKKLLWVSVTLVVELNHN